MRYQIVLVFSLLLILVACEGEKKHESIRATTKAVSAPPVPAPIDHEPYVIADSSKIQVLEGGVQMYIVEEGQGAIPTPTSKVIAHYHGMLTDGTVFDSSFDRGETSSFSLNGVIKGWTVSLSQVRCGSKVKLIIPPEMGYGANGRPSIPPNATLIFDVDLISTY